MKKYRSLASIIFVMLIWGSSVAVTKVLVTELPPVLFAFIRFSVASLCLLPLFIFSKKTTTAALKRSDYLCILLMGFTGVTFFYIAFNLSLVYTSASTGSLIQGFLPAAIALLGIVFLKEKLTRLQICGIILSTAGVILVGFFAAATDAGDSLKGNLLMIAAIISWSVYTIVSRKLNHISPITVTCLSGFAGTLLLLPAALFESGGSLHISLSFNGWAAVFYLGAVASALCYYLYNKALETLPAAQVGNFLNLEPIAGVVIAVMFLHEHIGTWQITGTILVFAGIVLSSIKGNR